MCGLGDLDPNLVGNAETNTFPANIALRKQLPRNDLTPYCEWYMGPHECAARFCAADVCLLCAPDRNSPRDGAGAIKADQANPTGVLHR